MAVELSSRLGNNLIDQNTIADAKEMNVGKVGVTQPLAPCRPPVPGHCTQRCRIGVAGKGK